MAAKGKKLKSAGKRKKLKVSVSKLSNKRLNKLAKQGKLKKKLSKGQLLKLAKERTQEKKDPGSLPDESPLENGHRLEDIPLVEADYEYYSNPERDLRFLTNLESDEKQPRKRKKDGADHDELEKRYEKQAKKAGGSKEINFLLPIKTKDKGVQLRMIEAKDLAEHDKPSSEPKIEATPEEKPLETLTTAELFVRRKQKLEHLKERIASVSNNIIENPEDNIKKLRELRLLLETNDPDVMVTCKKLVMVSLLEVFKDIIPDYNIRVTTEKEKEQSAKKETKQLREYEESLLSSYRKYLEFLEAMAKGKQIKSEDKKKNLEDRLNGIQVPKEAEQGIKILSVKCLCELLATHPHFNFRANVIAVVIPFVASKNTQLSDMVCSYIRRIFKEDRCGEVTLEIVRSTGRVIKSRQFDVEPKVLDTFLSLKIKEVDKGDNDRDSQKDKKKNWQKLSRREKKKKKQMKELEKELENAAVLQNKSRKLKVHTEIISCVFLTYFRILKQAQDSVLLSSVLEGIAKFAHLINVDFFDDLFTALNNLVDSGDLTYRESLCCVQTAFVILSGQGSALNIDPLRFYKHLYSTLFQLSAAGNNEDVPITLDCLDIMINKRKKQISQQRLAAFIKRLCTLTLQQSGDTALALLAAARSFIISDSKSDVLFDTEFEGQGMFLPELDDPEHCNAHNTSLFELHLTKRHYHPAVKKYSEHLAKGYSGAGVSSLPSEVARKSPIELYEDFNQSELNFNPPMQKKPRIVKKVYIASQFKDKDLTETAERTLTKYDNLDIRKLAFHKGLCATT